MSRISLARGGARRALAAALFAAAATAAWPGAATAEPAAVRARVASEAADAALARAVARFAVDAARLVDRRGATAYTYEDVTDGRAVVPDVRLAGPRPIAFTDCSGWVSYLLASVSPLHQAVLARFRLSAAFNHGPIDEASYPWPRAAVIRAYLAAQPAGADATGGFRRIDDFRRLRPGDVVAWCLGGWCRPRALTRIPAGDTGHTFVVVGAPTRVAPGTPGYRGDLDGVATLDTVPGRSVVGVVAVPVVDSSDVPHFDDSRGYASVPRSAPPGAVPGGLGSGTLWIALDAAGAPVQFRFALADPYFPNPATPQAVGFAAGRPVPSLDLGGDLIVARYANAADRLAGRAYGAPRVAIGGRGGLTVAAGTSLALAAPSSFVGPVNVARGAALSVPFDAALGANANAVTLAGRLILAGGFRGAAGRGLAAKPSGVLATTGNTVWGGPLSGRTLTIDAAGRLSLPAIGRTVYGRRTISLR